MSVDHRRFLTGVTEQRLNSTDIIICLQKVSGEGVPKSMGGYFFRDLRLADGMIERPLKLGQP
jgi:hypothetical protein